MTVNPGWRAVVLARDAQDRRLRAMCRAWPRSGDRVDGARTRPRQDGRPRPRHRDRGRLGDLGTDYKAAIAAIPQTMQRGQAQSAGAIEADAGRDAQARGGGGGGRHGREWHGRRAGRGSTALSQSKLSRASWRGLALCRAQDVGATAAQASGRHSAVLLRRAPADRPTRRRGRGGRGTSTDQGLGGARCCERSLPAQAIAIIVDEKMVDRLGMRAPVPVEVVTFGLEVTQAALEALGANAKLRLSPAGAAFVTDSGNHIVDCSFGPITDPGRLEERIGRIVGVVESGLFIGRAGPVFVADAAGVHRLDRPRAGKPGTNGGSR